jgi:FkbH-like protein
VMVPDLPADPMELPGFLTALRCFDNPFISTEDRARTTMYVADRQRVALKGEGRSLQEWLKLLELRVEAEALNEANLERAAQLFNKTNQMNLSTRRLTAPELLAWPRHDGRRLWTFRVADKFGEYGLCGIGSFVPDGSRGRLQDFLLSCRVMARGVEETMLCVVAQHARSQGCEELYAEFVPTPKNQPCERWFQSHPGMRQEQQTFRLSLSVAPEMPSHVQVTGN